MPYDGEFAKHGILRDFENNPLIAEMLEECDVRETENPSLPKSLYKIKRNNWTAAQVFAIDGSHRPIKVRNGYPGASAGFVSIATVMIDMEKLAIPLHLPTLKRLTRQQAHCQVQTLFVKVFQIPGVPSDTLSINCSRKHDPLKMVNPF
jgi:hypothetical protein